MLRQQSSTEVLATYGLTILILVLVIAAVIILTSAPPSILPKSCSIYGGLECSDIAYGSNSVGGSPSGSTLVVLASFSVPGTINVSTFNAMVGGVKSTSGFCTTNGMITGATMISQGGQILCVAYFPSSATSSLYSGTFNVSADYCTGSAHSYCPQSSGYTFAGTWKAQGGVAITTSYITQIATNTPVSTTITVR